MFLKIMHVYYMTYLATPQHKNPCPRGQEIYNFSIPFIGHHDTYSVCLIFAHKIRFSKSSGDLLLQVGVRRLSSVTIFFSRTSWPILTKFGMQHLYGREILNCKFHDPLSSLRLKGRLFCVKCLKLMYFFKNTLYFGPQFRKTVYK